MPLLWCVGAPPRGQPRVPTRQTLPENGQPRKGIRDVRMTTRGLLPGQHVFFHRLTDDEGTLAEHPTKEGRIPS